MIIPNERFMLQAEISVAFLIVILDLSQDIVISKIVPLIHLIGLLHLV